MNRILRIRASDKDIFDDLKSGRKSIETRARTKLYEPLTKGDTLTFVCGGKKLRKTITKVYRWRGVNALYREIPFKKVLPRVGSVEEAKRAHLAFPGYAEKIRASGLVGFKLR